MAAVTIFSDFGAPKNSLTLFPLFPHLFAMKWWDQMPWSSFSECWALSQLFHSPLSLSSRGILVPLHLATDSQFLFILNVFILLSFLEDRCAGYKIFGWQLFSCNTWVCHSTVFWPPLFLMRNQYAVSHFCIAAFKILFCLCLLTYLQWYACMWIYLYDLDELHGCVD